MKIHLFALHLAFGGVEKAVTNMANIFCEKYDVEIICMYNMPDSPAYILDERVKVSYLLDTVPNKKEFVLAVKERNPLKIIKEGWKSFQILIGKKKELKKVILGINNGVIITTRHEDTLMLSKYGNPNVYKIAQLHHDHFNDEKMMKQFDNGYKNIDVFCLLTEQLKLEVEQSLQINKKMKCCVIPNFIENIPSMPVLEKKKQLFVATGRFHEVKGFDRLLEIMLRIHEKCPEWKLLLIGDGEKKDELNDFIKKNKMQDYVDLSGQKNSCEIEMINKVSSVYLMTSYSEGLPYVLIEAQSCALPIIAYDVRVGPRAVIQDGYSGFLIKDGDIDEFVNKTVLIVNNAKLRNEMAINAYKDSHRYSKEHVSEMWFQIIDQARKKGIK